ncbi:MAG: hypothetical protein AB1405_05015 [Bdellovibrionota bacterium]
MEPKSYSSFQNEIDEVIARNKLRLTTSGKGVTWDGEGWDGTDEDWEFLNDYGPEIADRLRELQVLVEIPQGTGSIDPLEARNNSEVVVREPPRPLPWVKDKYQIPDLDSLPPEHGGKAFPVRKELPFGDAYMHRRFGKGEKLHVDVSSLNLPKFTQKDFPKGPGDEKRVKVRGKGGYVYGTVTARLNENGTISIKPDKYNFDIKRWQFFPLEEQTVTRNIATIGAALLHGGGTPFDIEFVGEIPLSDE